MRGAEEERFGGEGGEIENGKWGWGEGRGREGGMKRGTCMRERDRQTDRRDWYMEGSSTCN